MPRIHAFSISPPRCVYAYPVFLSPILHASSIRPPNSSIIEKKKKKKKRFVACIGVSFWQLTIVSCFSDKSSRELIFQF